MDLDPDVALPSIEPKEVVGTSSTPRQSDTPRNVSSRINNSRPESSPSRTPFKTPRSRPPTPGTTTTPRSPSVSSLRHERPEPKLDRKRSVPNLSIARSATPGPQPQFRRASSNLNPATPTRMKSLERPRMTPSSVAKDYFGKELGAHSKTGSRVVVFTHDSCYGHRFSRPRSTKAALASIVERPERIHATLLGASTAYVRLGDRHKDGKYGPRPDHDPDTVLKPPFTIRKSTRSIPLNHPAVTSVHGTKWMEGLQIMCDTAEANLAVGRKELTRPISHTKDARGHTLPALHPGDLYLSAESLEALQGCLGGVCDALDTVFQSETAQRAFVCIRPPGHHCSSEMPSGFCWLNNVHVGISYAAMNHGLTHAAIIDFDLHHGDGSQTITWDHNRAVNTMQNPKSAPAHKKIPIGYYSLHDINSYPCEYGDEEKVRNASTCLHTAHGQSIWNVHLEPWQSHTDFWRVYRSKYFVLLEKAYAFLQHHSDQIREAGGLPKAAIFLSSGFDASEWESEFMQRHKVNVPTDFYAKFTADVVELSNQAGLGVDGRIISVLEGGYSDRALASGVLSHLCGLTHNTEQEAEIQTQHGLTAPVPEVVTPETLTYDPAWWSVEHLELLEAMVSGNLPQPPSKSKDKPLSSYTSPTKASNAKMTVVAKERRSLSAQLEARLQLENAPPEPPPEVDWVTAAYELSRLLIPDDRQTLSCTHEELNAENSRTRRDRQSLMGAVSSDVTEEKMQLRDRKPKQTNLASQPKVATRTGNRRTTIAAASELPDPSAPEPARPRRRSSAASSVLSGFQDLKLEGEASENSNRSSSRIGSTASSKSQASLPARKTRAPAVKKPASATSSPRKPKAAVDTSARLDAVNETKSSTLTRASNPEQSTNGVSDSATQDGMDDLTNGMKKISIKLKMPTEDQHIANQRSAAEPSKARARVAKNPPIPRATGVRTKPTIGSKAATVPSNPTVSPHVQPDSENISVISPSADDVDTNEPSLTPTTAPSSTNVPEVKLNHAHDHDPASNAGVKAQVEISYDDFQPATNVSPAVLLPQTAPQGPFHDLDSKDNFTEKMPQPSSTAETLRPDGNAQQMILYPTISLKTESTTSSQEDSTEKKKNGSSTSVWDIPATPQK